MLTINYLRKISYIKASRGLTYLARLTSYLGILLLITFLLFIKSKQLIIFGKQETHKYQTKVVSRSGSWSWFSDPRAVYVPKYSRTYIGWVDNIGSIIIASYNHKSGLATRANIANKFQDDDHVNPAIYITPGSRIVAFWSAHTGRDMFYRITKRPADITSWEPPRKVGVNVNKKEKIGYTYANPQYLSNEKKLYLFWRGGNRKPTFSTTVNLKKWSKARTLIEDPALGRPYIKIDSNGRDTIHFAFTEGHPSEQQTSIYYFYYRKGSFYKADGTYIGNMTNLPIQIQNVDKVYDANQNGVRAWIHDVAFDNNGKPVIVYATFPSLDDHRYRYARWINNSWFDTEITAAGGSFNPPPLEQHYSGGIVLSHDNPSVVYLSRKINKAFHIEKWWTKDGGLSWSSKRVSHTGSKNVRPFVPRGIKTKNLSVMWMRGTYEHFKKYNTSLVSILYDKPRNKPPDAMFRSSIRKGKAPLVVTFNGRLSKDRDGKIVKWRWNFGDGSPIAFDQQIQKHTFNKRGRFFVMLDIKDNKGKRDKYTSEIIVK